MERVAGKLGMVGIGGLRGCSCLGGGVGRVGREFASGEAVVVTIREETGEVEDTEGGAGGIDNAAERGLGTVSPLMRFELRWLASRRREPCEGLPWELRRFARMFRECGCDCVWGGDGCARGDDSAVACVWGEERRKWGAVGDGVGGCNTVVAPICQLPRSEAVLVDWCASTVDSLSPSSSLSLRSRSSPPLTFSQLLPPELVLLPRS